MKSISIPNSIVPGLSDLEVGEKACVKLDGEITGKSDDLTTMDLEEASLQDPGEYEDEETHKKRTLVIGIVDKPRRMRSESY